MGASLWGWEFGEKVGQERECFTGPFPSEDVQMRSSAVVRRPSKAVEFEFRFVAAWCGLR
ncbi:hypothetical protein CEE69_00580 [Rhodopirellula bahusiensis]|uniref:Uncharacterized protein n=1 Tax=Rhodopirellula bahusiensis TaxID=2014065 RepID=A0A2G1WCZ4_9BACT|nr:hypothetical protein CEE69_00580 [Rhodopirellula bahusiensis]